MKNLEQNLQQHTITHQPPTTKLAELLKTVKNTKQLYTTNNPYSAPSTTSYSYEKLNEDTDITSKK